MKFWHKIYLFSLLAFVLIFNAASIMVIEQSHNKMLSQEINSALSKNMSIHSSVDAIVPILRIYDSIDYEKTVLTNIANEFVQRNSDEPIYLDIKNEKQHTIFSNADFKMPAKRGELDKLAEDQINYILRDIGQRTILFTTNMTDINHKSYVFTYMKDVTSVYQGRVDQYRFFVKVDVAACFLYMLIMFFVSRGLTRPIDRLNRTAQVIAQGDFSERASFKSKDEIGVLARNFNDMASVVEDKINDLERHNLEKQRFIDNFTHELKTPLTSIIGYANFLRTTKYNEELFLDGLDVIYSEGKRLESLSLKLMDLILLQKDKFQFEEHDLGAIITEIEPALKMKAKEKRISILMDCEVGRLLLEKDLIKTMIFNLVDNAIKASAEEQRITLRTYWMDSRYILEVIDQGIGIAKEHWDKIFEPFYMADKARTKTNNGAGLGLSICQSVASMHHAFIEVNSKENEGTTIRVIFAHTSPKGVMNP
ncbi:two-component sensor histidine kinase [Paenibacillus baekrokdamisoli]|uniref:histidine kinase n=1 Tax=Paenibacillus baekrokdamisoli TaxID=1712516 RepID=A0A3G9J751_9BACL|nr:HAMP domain-containing sensor histidine kinase [Paenibacillus baekrokdamisoli]MBB3067649.1 signal transduction histidine kinase [Paenibacillus baekrokdamisoli]BBH19164.1 two-component sensor histidine kinase [Paenibacillus baekrokdamisoli]